MSNFFLNYYFKVNYFAQKAFGWKDSKEGFKNFIVASVLYISSGFVVFFLSYIEHGFYLWLVYAFLYYKFVSSYIEDKLEKKVNFNSFDESYENISLTSKILFTIASILFLIMNILIMVALIYVLAKIFK